MSSIARDNSGSVTKKQSAIIGREIGNRQRRKRREIWAVIMRKLHCVPFPFDQIAKRPRRISIDCAEFTPLREVTRFRSEVVIGLVYSFYDGKAEMLIKFAVDEGPTTWIDRTPT